MILRAKHSMILNLPDRSVDLEAGEDVEVSAADGITIVIFHPGRFRLLTHDALEPGALVTWLDDQGTRGPGILVNVEGRNGLIVSYHGELMSIEKDMILEADIGPLVCQRFRAVFTPSDDEPSRAELAREWFQHLLLSNGERW